MTKQAKYSSQDSPYRYVCRELMETRQKVGELAAAGFESGDGDVFQLQRMGARAETLAELEKTFRYKGWDD